MTAYLFSYGTLQKENVQVELFGRLLTGAKDSLKGYRLSPVEITDELFLSRGEEKYQLTIIHSKNEKDIINGTVFEITEKELFLADQYEPTNYKRIKVLLVSGKEAWIYTAT